LKAADEISRQLKPEKRIMKEEDIARK